MYDGFIPWLRERQSHHHAGAGCGARGGYDSEAVAHLRQFAHGFGHGDEGGGGSFGVRRPLRFLAYKLELKDQQTAELAKILDELKTERAQAAVDDRRAVAAFSESVAGASFDAAKAAEAAKGRAETAERLGKAVSGALAKIHALLEPQQREQLAYLVRTGTLSL